MTLSPFVGLDSAVQMQSMIDPHRMLADCRSITSVPSAHVPNAAKVIPFKRAGHARQTRVLLVTVKLIT